MPLIYKWQAGGQEVANRTGMDHLGLRSPQWITLGTAKADAPVDKSLSPSCPQEPCDLGWAQKGAQNINAEGIITNQVEAPTGRRAGPKWKENRKRLDVT